ncbi:MAG: amidohydrolase family protein [Saprospiraceae bacterium]|nr:amidohydrolase family protein [Saprospiraceae bacterium]
MTKRSYRGFALIFLLASYTAASGQTVFLDVDVIPMTTESVLSRQAVIVEDGRIVQIVSADQYTPRAGATVIDGSGKYLVPGWAEMHAHIPTPTDGDDSNVRETLFLYLANGITTIRGMLGDPYHLELKKQIDQGAFPSPRVYTSSPSLNGNSISTKEEAKQKVTQYKQDGYDFLKVHPGIQKDVFDEMVATANAVGIDFSGHVPADVGIRHAIASNYASIDHLDGYIEGLAPEEKRKDGGFFGVLLHNHLDESKISELVHSTKEAGIAIVPTQTLMTRWLLPGSAEAMVNEPEMKYIPGSLRYTWRQSKERMMENLDYEEAGYRQFIQVREKVLKALHDAGVPLLLGSDAPQVANVPGFSIHHEMQDMIDVGLSPQQVLRTGTVNVATFFNRSDEFGTIEPGKIADLVLLSNNPLEDISHAQEIEGVMYRGHWLSKEYIQDRLRKIAKQYE